MVKYTSLFIIIVINLTFLGYIIISVFEKVSNCQLSCSFKLICCIAVIAGLFKSNIAIHIQHKMRCRG